VKLAFRSLLAMSFGCSMQAGRKGQGVHQNSANSMAMSGMGCRKAVLGTGWAISLLICRNELKTAFWLCKASISGHFSQSIQVVLVLKVTSKQ